MTDRIKRMKDNLTTDRFYICTEKYVITIDSYIKNAAMPVVLKRARATADYFDKRTLYVDDDELIVGNVAAKPHGMEASIKSKFWSGEDIEALSDYFIFDPKEMEVIRSYDSFWDTVGLSLDNHQGFFYDDDGLWPFIKSGILCPPWKEKRNGRGNGGAGGGWGLGIGMSFFVPDYEYILKTGISPVVEMAKEKIKTLVYDSDEAIDAKYYLEGVIEALSAMARMYHRYGTVCEEAAKTASPERAKELLQMADSCHYVADHGARNFRDAMQAYWFYWITVAHGTSPGGRFDQFMYPYYKQDIENGTLTPDEALEYLECLRIKIMQYGNVTGGAMQRAKWAGAARWHNFLIGGYDRNGKDASNELSKLVLKAAYEVRVPHYTITLRVTEDTPDDLMMEAMKLVKTGIGMPAFVSDKSYIAGLVAQGVAIEDARDYALAGCLDMNLPGKSRINALGMFIVPKVLDITMHNGFCKETGEQVGLKTGEMKDFKTYEDFYNAFTTQLYRFLGFYNQEHNILINAARKTSPDVIHSAFAYQGIESGQDIMYRKMPYEIAGMLNPVGMINVANSLMAIKKVIFEDKAYTMEDMYNAIEANWEGYEDLRERCLAAPKFGNDIDEVDQIAVQLYKFWADSAKTFKTLYNEAPKVTGISITAHAPGGSYTCATPDGRFYGETLCDGVASPAQGTDKNGPTASLASAMKIDQDAYNAMLLNMKIHPSALKSDDDLRKLGLLVKTYLTNGGKHIQFNVVDNKTLIAAQEKPSEYKELIVRVAGYSTYFTLLTKPVQNELIKRTENIL